jgi:adenylate cyclase
MAEEILDALSGIQGLRVSSRTASFRSRTPDADTREIGRRLRVGTLLEGSVRKSADQLRIVVQLTDAESGFQLWSGRYDRKMSDIFAVQREIAENVVGALEVTLSQNERTALGKPRTADVRAYDCYLRGRRFYYQYSPQAVEFCFAMGQLAQAARLYEESMRVNPDDYQSPLLAAQIYDDLGRPAEGIAARKRGVEVAERHLRLNPDDARALYMAANALVALGKCPQGQQWAERALAIRPNDPMLLYNVGCVFSMLGRVEPAIECLEEAARNGLTQKGWYENDSNLDPLREHRRFQELLEKLC